jgi:hypothetical protein
MCNSLMKKKDTIILDILQQSYADTDVIFLQVVLGILGSECFVGLCRE